MKPIIFAVFFICLALNARAQQNQQVDSAPPVQWVRLNSGVTSLITTVSYPCADTIWAGALLRSTDAGETWLPIPHPGGEGLFLSSSEGILLGGGSTVFVTHNAGNTWDTVNTGRQVTTFCWESPDTCFVLGGGGAYSTDGGLTWDTASFNTPWEDFAGVSFCNSKVGYTAGPLAAGPFPYQNQMAGECYKTTDGGAHWIQLFTAIQNGLSAVAALNPDTVLVMVNNIGIYRTTDGGNTWDWQTPLFSFPANAGGGSIAMEGNYGFVAGGGAGAVGYIIHTTDAGTTWTQESNSNTPGNLYGVSMLDDSDAIAVGDNGVILKRTTGSSGVSQQQAIDSLYLQVFPNPSQQTLSIQYSLSKPQHVSLLVYDVSGHLVNTFLASALQNAGQQMESFNTVGLSAGNYFLQFSSENYSSSTPFIINQ